MYECTLEYIHARKSEEQRPGPKGLGDGEGEGESAEGGSCV